MTQLPAPVDVAATWDTAAEQQYGQIIGAEQAAKGATVDLGPTINIDRDPRWGRAFPESIGEDPYLNGQLGAASIRGVQSAGTAGRRSSTSRCTTRRPTATPPPTTRW